MIPARHAAILRRHGDIITAIRFYVHASINARDAAFAAAADGNVSQCAGSARNAKRSADIATALAGCGCGAVPDDAATYATTARDAAFAAAMAVETASYVAASR